MITASCWGASHPSHCSSHGNNTEAQNKGQNIIFDNIYIVKSTHRSLIRELHAQLCLVNKGIIPKIRIKAQVVKTTIINFSFCISINFTGDKFPVLNIF